MPDESRVPTPVETFDKTFDPRPKIVQTLPDITRISANPGLRDAFLARLERSEADIGYPELLYAFDVVHSPQEVAHLKKHWFGHSPDGRGEWFDKYQPLRRKFRESMTQAFRLAQARNVPIFVYWVVPMETVEHIVLPHATHISMFRLTPMPPEPLRRRSTT